MLATFAPFPQYFDVDGEPLDAGSLYFGVANQNPETNPIAVYWDAAGTQPAAQPVRTLNGYSVRGPSPGVIFAGSDYSLSVRNSRGVLVYYSASAAALSNDFAFSQFIANIVDPTNLAYGDALVAVKQPDANSVARTQHDKNSDELGLLDFLPGGGDDTVRFQNAADSKKRIRVPRGNYTISTVNIGVYGCDFVLDKEAVITVTANGFRRSLLQTPRATFIAANALLDATNYYFSMKITGGVIQVGAGCQAISDRVPFLVNTAAAPSQILLRRNLIVEGVDIMLNAASSKAIGIYGGWGTTVRGGSITGFGTAAIAFDIGASSADGDVTCHPQEILIDDVVVNSCAPFASAKNGCNNAAEDLTVRASKFNFVTACSLNNINSLRWVGANQYVTDTGSMVVTDCNHVSVLGNYFESNHDPLDAANPGIVNFQNCPNLKFVDNDVFTLATAVATARDGILVKANAVSAARGTRIVGNRFQHAAFNATLETNAIRIATGGGTGQLLDIVIKDNICNDWHNAVNFTDHITTQATGVEISGNTNANGLRFLKGIARIATNSLRAPGVWEQFSLALSANSIGGGAASTVGSDFWPTVMRSAAPVVTVTNFANLANANGIGAAWAAIGANSVHITMTQTAASVAGALVQATATITVDGTLV